MKIMIVFNRIENENGECVKEKITRPKSRKLFKACNTARNPAPEAGFSRPLKKCELVKMDVTLNYNTYINEKKKYNKGRSLLT